MADELAAIRVVLAAHRSTETHVTEEQLEAAWAEYEDARVRLRGIARLELEREAARYGTRLCLEALERERDERGADCG